MASKTQMPIGVVDLSVSERSGLLDSVGWPRAVSRFDGTELKRGLYNRWFAPAENRLLPAERCLQQNC